MIIDKLMSYTVLLILISGLWAQSDYEEYLKKDQQAFAEYEASITAEYENYELEDKEAFEKFKQEVEEKWEEFKSPTNKEYVEYDDKKESRTSVDFEKGIINTSVLNPSLLRWKSAFSINSPRISGK